MSKSNPMQTIKIQKLCINTNVKPKENRLDKAVAVLKQIAGQEPFISKSRLTVRGWGIRRNEKVSASVTIRGEKAEELLKAALQVKEFELPEDCFSNNGCFGFGIEEHIDLGIKYDPLFGIFGFNYFVVLEKPGMRISKRKRCTARVGKKQKVDQEEARKWFVEKFDGVLQKVEAE
ncbi:hypothetical protein NUSPORA_02106 [Nucleospora cyclopteri]